MRTSDRSSHFTLWTVTVACALVLCGPGAGPAWDATADGRDSAPGSVGVAPTGVAARPSVEEIRVEGHETIRARDVRRIFEVGLGGVLDEDTVAGAADSVLRVLSEAGRPFGKVHVSWREHGEGVLLSVEIDEGPELAIGEIVLEGAHHLGAREIEGLLSIGPGATIRLSKIETGIDHVLSRYEDTGYPFATVSPLSSSMADGGALNLALAVDEGRAIRFGEVLVSGNTVTKDHVVTRGLGIREGQPYSGTEVAAIRPHLERMGLFSHVEDPLVAVDPLTGVADIGVAVEEGRSNRITGAVGYVPSVGNGDGYFTGRFDLGLANIAGTGRSVWVLWSRIRPEYTDVSFEYTEPYVLGAPINVGISGEQSVRDTLYTTTGADLHVTALMPPDLEVTWSLGRERYVPGPTLGNTTTSYSTALSAVYDRTDEPLNPRTGFRVSGSVTYAAKDEADTDRNESSGLVRLDGQLFVAPRANHVVALSADVAGISSTEHDVPFHEQLTLGGAMSLRGYREEQFRGTRTALGGVEYRFLLGRRSRAHVFVDVGYYYRGGSNPITDTKLGYGIGLRGESRLGIISMDYGLGEGDGVLDGKLHVGLTQEF